jgi:hypothetical protein
MIRAPSPLLYVLPLSLSVPLPPLRSSSAYNPPYNTIYTVQTTHAHTYIIFFTHARSYVLKGSFFFYGRLALGISFTVYVVRTVIDSYFDITASMTHNEPREFYFDATSRSALRMFTHAQHYNHSSILRATLRCEAGMKDLCRAGN